MILPIKGKWSAYASRWFLYERLYNTVTNEKTVWCRVKFRYLKTIRELHANQRITNSPVNLRPV